MPGILQARLWVPAATAAYAFDPARKSASMTLSNSNHTTTGTANDPTTGYSSAVAGALSGTLSIKFQANGGAAAAGRLVGICNSSANIDNFMGFDTNSAGWYDTTGDIIYNAGIVPGYNIGTYTVGDIVEIEFDIPGSQVRARVNSGSFCAWLSLAGIGAGPYQAGASVFSTGIGWTIIP